MNNMLKVVLTSSVVSVVISGIFSVINNIFTNRKNTKISKQKIDADLQAQSRIKWIQDVRKVTTDLLSAHYDLSEDCEKDNKDDIPVALRRVRHQTLLFSLYFSSLYNSEFEFDLSEESPSILNILDSKLSPEDKENKRKKILKNCIMQNQRIVRPKVSYKIAAAMLIKIIF